MSDEAAAIPGKVATGAAGPIGGGAKNGWPRMANGYPATPLEYALRYAAQGWRVLPVKPHAKRPLTAHGVQDATTDEARLRQWWQRWPNANLGLAMGRCSGVFALDVDPRHGGEGALDRLKRQVEAAEGAWPDTVEALTGGGGTHLLFRYPATGRVPSRTLAPELEVKSDGTYLVVEPSIHPSGQACVFCSKVATDSTAKLPPIPDESGH